jgi:CPA2 family monovalent cation:H+ antiporter-2
MNFWDLVLDIVVLLTACMLAGAVFSRLRQSPLVGYLVAGMLLGGPGSFRLIRAEEHIETIAELGVAMLLFSLGLEFSWRRLQALGMRTLVCGVAQISATTLVAIVVALLLGQPLIKAVVIGAMLSLSSTAAVLRMLTDLKEIDSSYGRNSVAVLLVQDMAVVPMAILVTLLATGGTALEVVQSVFVLLGWTVVLVGSLFVLLNYVAVWLLKAIAVEQNRELTILLAVVTGIGATWAAHAVGLSPALGAFIAGMFLGNSPFATQVRADISSLRVVLLTLFFGAVGMVADPIWIVRNLPLLLGLAALILAVKTAIVTVLFRFAGYHLGVALATGLCLSQVGEFAFVLGSIGKQNGILNDDLYTLIVSCSIVTLLATPYIVQSAPAAAHWIEGFVRRAGGGTMGNDQVAERPPEIVIIGFGAAGQRVGTALGPCDRKILVIDLNAAAARTAESMGFSTAIGDASITEVLEHAQVYSAKLVAITVPARSAAITILHHVRSRSPLAFIVVRSRYQIHQSDFEQVGADAVVGDEDLVGRNIAEQVCAQVATWPPPEPPS